MRKVKNRVGASGRSATARQITALAALSLVVVAGGCSAQEESSSAPSKAVSTASTTPTAASSAANQPSVGAKPKPSPTSIPTAADTPPTFASDPPGRQDSVLANLPGNSKTGCVPVGQEQDVRSGSMAAGNFELARAAWSVDPKAKLAMYFIPADVRGNGALTVKVSRPDGSSSTSFTSATAQTANSRQYFPASIVVEGSGTWRIRATVGKNSGCWETNFDR